MHFPFEDVRFIMKEFNLEYDSINSGGCGVMASIVATNLKDIVDDYRIVSCGGWASIDEARKCIRENNTDEWADKGVELAHVWIEFRWGNKWYAIDSTGVYTLPQM